MLIIDQSLNTLQFKYRAELPIDLLSQSLSFLQLQVCDLNIMCSFSEPGLYSLYGILAFVAIFTMYTLYFYISLMSAFSECYTRRYMICPFYSNL